jgi:CBS domain-containing protein
MSVLPRHRTVADVMTVRVHVASPVTPFKLLVRLIEDNRISAVPVVNQEGVPVGVVSESDLLFKKSWPRRASIAADLMTSPAVTVRTDASIPDAARLMHQRQLRRLIVVDARGRIAGIVTRSDLLQVFLRTDEDLRSELVDRIIPAIVPGDAETIEVDVRSNVVTLSGEVDRNSDVDILGRMALDIEGVVDVINRLRFRWNDLRRPATSN